MTKKARYTNSQNIEEFASAVIAHSKNGPRAVFRLIKELSPGLFEVTYSDLPQNGQNYEKIMRVQSESLWGIYDSRVKLEQLVSDLSYKG